MTMPAAFVEIAQLGKTYPTPTGPAEIVRDFTLDIAQGEFVCIVGHSGCGKSTVLSIVMGLNQPTTGGVVIAGREVSGPGTDRGVVLQSATLLPWLSVFENVALAVDAVNPGVPAAERKRKTEEFIARVNLTDAKWKRPRELSGGMRQRVAVARGLAMRPKPPLIA